MKHLMWGIIAATLVVIAGFGVILFNAKVNPKERVAQTVLDSAEVVRIVENHYNPEISSVGGAISVQNELIAIKNYENIFKDMPQQVLIEVVGVLLKEKPHEVITLRDVAKEYESNKRIYNNLPRKQPMEVDTLYDNQNIK
jgi:hypothetical protein|nr:MAG TPA: hypothetical protein [Caudoviricetes sp.]